MAPAFGLRYRVLPSMPDMGLLLWTRTRPTRPGWYWLRRPDHAPMVVQLLPSNRGLVAEWPGRWFLDPIREGSYDDAEWCGPIQPP